MKFPRTDIFEFFFFHNDISRMLTTSSTNLNIQKIKIKKQPRMTLEIIPKFGYYIKSHKKNKLIIQGVYFFLSTPIIPIARPYFFLHNIIKPAQKLQLGKYHPVVNCLFSTVKIFYYAVVDVYRPIWTFLLTVCLSGDVNLDDTYFFPRFDSQGIPRSKVS